MSYVVYRHTSPSGKAYVGITCQKPERRWSRGVGYVSNQYFTHAIKKYGWDNFTHEILLEGLTKEQAELAEQLFIGYWDLMNSEKGYNLESGGNAQHKASEASRRKMSESTRGEKHPNYGKRMSEETRRRISEANTGYKHTDEAKAKMSKSHAGVPMDTSTRQKISKTMSGRVLSEDTKKKISRAKDDIKRPVVMLDIDSGDLIKRFDSIADASKDTSVQYANIWKCCNHLRNSTCGYRWMYTEEYDNG